MNALLLRSRLHVAPTVSLPRLVGRYSHSYRRLQSTAVASYDQSVDIFPSIVIGPNKSIVPQGPFAEAQAQVSCCFCVLVWVLCGYCVGMSNLRCISLLRTILFAMLHRRLVLINIIHPIHNNINKTIYR
jgi:hypothetical protein